jgi:Domain of unknown function (DUF4386)
MTTSTSIGKQSVVVQEPNLTTREPGITKGDSLQKISSAGFILGAILIGIGGLLMPNAAKPTSDLHEMLTPLGEHASRTIVSSLLMVIGFWAVLIGAAGIYRSIIAGGAAWARLGFYFVVGGTVLWTISLANDIGTANLVANWLASPTDGQEALWSVIAALSVSARGLLALTWMIYWLALAFLGIGMLRSAVYPRWLGWAGFISSIPMVALGIVQMFTLRSTLLTLVFAVLMLLTTLWFFVVGIWVERKAW